MGPMQQYTTNQETFAIHVQKNVNAEILLIDGKSYTQICTTTGLNSSMYFNQWLSPTQGLIQNYQLMVLQEGEIRHVPVLALFLYVRFRNSRVGK